ncbi:MAG TPA: tail fiber domain-containing protein [Chryseolinea sp.]|nr:tail fiber domain-containing protein [Chryseolinea sp.]
MQKMLTLIVLVHAFTSIQAQTHYGTGAGTSGTNHSYFGNYAGNATTGSDNSYFGANSGRYSTTAASNTGVGAYSLYSNTSGYWNTAVGAFAMYLNTTGLGNTAVGRNALYNNTTGSYNVAGGYSAMLSNTTGQSNTAIGAEALFQNSLGSLNVAAGSGALKSNTTGNENTASGSDALSANTTGNGNSAYGWSALTITNGSYNCAFGAQALFSTCTGSYNTAFGAKAGLTQSGTCSYNNATALGYNTQITGSNQVRIGNSSVTSIGGPVAWTTLSDGRFKRNVNKNVAGLDFINQLDPVSYTLDKEAINSFLGLSDDLQSDHVEARNAPELHIGFVAQDVDAIIKKSRFTFGGVQTPLEENDPYTIRYDEFVVPLVKAVQELTIRSEEQRKEIRELKTQLGSDNSTASLNSLAPGNVILFQNHSTASRIVQLGTDATGQVLHGSITISTLRGSKLKEITINDGSNATIDLSTLEFSPGMYLYTFVADGKVIDTKHLVVTK